MRKNIKKFILMLFVFLLLIFVLFNCPQSSNSCDDDDDNHSKATTYTIPDEMVMVDGGTFTMGSTEFIEDWMEPTHDVTVSSFYIWKYETTNQEVVDVFNWALDQGDKITASAASVTNIVGDTQELLGLSILECQIQYSDGTFSLKNNDLSNYPCVVITWYGAVAFCNYLSEKDGIIPCYDLSDWSLTISNNGYRLPTEAEWEYTARNKGIRVGKSYSGANYDTDETNWPNAKMVAWFLENSGFITHEVGIKQANELGIYDMSGNVWEWCYDRYGNYGIWTETDPIGPSNGNARTARGGSWAFESIKLCSSYRNLLVPMYNDSNLGFRIVKRP